MIYNYDDKLKSVLEPKPGSELGSDIRIAEILDVHRGTVWRLTREDPTFPRPIKLSRGATRWRLDEVFEWIASRAKASA